MAIMTAAPLIVHYLENRGLELMARLMSYAGYIWMGFLVLFISASFFIDIYRLIVHVTGLIISKDMSAFAFSAGLSFYIAVLFALSAGIYGYFDAKDIRVERLTIRTNKIPEEHNSFKIVQISDVHIGLIIRDERIKKIMKLVNEENPDIFISTGDLVDGQINNLEGLAELFQEVNPEYGKIAITGNHEFYAGLDQALDFTRRSGFKILRGESIDIDGIINIAGVDDRAGIREGLYKDVPEKKLLAVLDRSRFTLLLKHIPLVDESALGLFDLQLSGHTHKGQIFPFNLLTRLYYPRHAGYLHLGKGSSLYTSRGTGTWGPPIRFLSPPEITVIELIHR